ncbi:MAG TPA: hypothetical protein DCS93_28275 [Microscillaceae bacterium]|nr:hypothetical protein [Microscillaceae bacterium]
MKRISLFCTLCLICLGATSTLHAQNVSVLKLGTSTVNNNQWGEVLYGVGNIPGNELGMFESGWGIAAGFEFNSKEIVPKVSLGATWGMIFTTSLNLSYYAKRSHRIVFTPEIGLNILKLAHVTYGYQLNQVSFYEGRRDVSKHRISVFLTIPVFIH